MTNGVDMRELRRYEISIWTLQDRFLSVLKWFDLDQKGQVQDPTMTLKDDGTQELTFSIPKFYYDGDKKIQNPVWLQMDKMPIQADMHKLKVIFNKNIGKQSIENLDSFVISLNLLVFDLFEHPYKFSVEDFPINTIDSIFVKVESLLSDNVDVELKIKRIKRQLNLQQQIFEFLVTSVTEEHSADRVSIAVKAEGLAFHELGKIGYKISLNSDDFLLDQENWFKNEPWGEEPVEDIHYWNKKIFGDENNWITNWKYRVDMDWSSHSYAHERRSNQVYEDEYVASWETSDDKLNPKYIEGARVKWRSIDVKESNIYNITQTIAEQFGVFCRYEYEHNENYQITNRVVVYYNNYIQDKQGHIDLTYPYNSSMVTRTVDASNITTKLFVRPVNDNSNNTEILTINDVEANKSGEDYLLNFDYLHEIGSINQEQYDAIEDYIYNIRVVNDKLTDIQERIRILNNELVEQEARKVTAQNGIGLDDERYQEATDALSALTGDDGLTPYCKPFAGIADYKQEGQYYISAPTKGIIESSIHLYKDYNYKQNQPIHEILPVYPIIDEFGQVSKITYKDAGGTIKSGWISYNYDPNLYYKAVQTTWANRRNIDQAIFDAAEKRIEQINFWLSGSRVGYGVVGGVQVDSGSFQVGVASDNGIYWDITREVIISRADQSRTITTNIETINDEAFTEEVLNLDQFYNTVQSPELYWNRDRYLSIKKDLINAFERMMGPALREGYWQPEDYNDYGDVYKDKFKIYPVQDGKTKVYNGIVDSPLTGEEDVLQSKYCASFIWDWQKIYDNETSLLYESSVTQDAEQFITIDLTKYLDGLQVLLNDEKQELTFFYYDVGVIRKIYEIQQSILNYEETTAHGKVVYTENNQSIEVNANVICNNLRNAIAILSDQISIQPHLTDTLSWYINDDKGINYNRLSSETLQAGRDLASIQITAINQELDKLEKNINDFTTWSSTADSDEKQVYDTCKEQLSIIKSNLLRVYTSRNFADSQHEWIANLEKNALRSLTVNSQCELGWIQDFEAQENSYGMRPVIPVLILTGAKNFDKETINFIVNGNFVSSTGTTVSIRDTNNNLYKYQSFLGKYKVNESTGNLTLEPDIERIYISYGTKNESSNNDIYFNILTEQVFNNEGNERYPTYLEYRYRRVYPRIYFNTLKLKNNASDLQIKLNNQNLVDNEDYYTVIDDRSEGLNQSGIGYYTTFRPGKLFSLGSGKFASIELLYTLSNADVAIYLDAIKVMKENAYPKLSYDVKVSVLNSYFIQTDYNRLNQIVQINDNDLQLDEINGYISSVTLHLDKPWEDDIEIKNYQTKFEDLFSTIVAQTEVMKKSENGLQSAISAFTANGLIEPQILQNSIRSANLQLAFNQGKLTISEENGIWATSDDGTGVVAMRGGGIFTATEKDASGEWLWNTGILPSGINANLITSGQLDTNLIRIFSGDDLRFQWNGEGIYAYRSGNSIPPEILEQGININSLDKKQYVLYNSEGLFLHIDTGIVKNNGQYQLAELNLNRVEISWNGLILRDNKERDVFFADPDTGNLTLKGTIEAVSGSIGGWDLDEHQLQGKGIRLRSGPADTDAGVYLTDQTWVNDIVVDEKTGITYYMYTDMDHPENVYYLRDSSAQEVIITDGYVYEQIRRISSVVPRYQLSVSTYTSGTQIDSNDEQGGTDSSTPYTIIANAQSSQITASTKIYVMLNAEKTEYAVTASGEKIEYDFTNTLQASWYQKLISQYSDYQNYIDITYDTTYQSKPIQGTLRLKASQAITFSVQASGYTTILSGKIGNFQVNKNSMSSGTLTGCLLDKSNIVINDQNNIHTLGEVFYDITSNSDEGTFTLKRVNGDIVNFNIAAMQAYRNAIAAAAQIQLSLVLNDEGEAVATATSGGGVTVSRSLKVSNGTVSISSDDGGGGGGGGSSGSNSGICEQCAKSCFHSCARGCGDECNRGCAAICSTGCAGACGDACSTGCGNGCGSNCSTGCGIGCGSGCTNECTSCGGLCSTGACRGGCTGRSTITCGYSCSYNTM